MSSTAYTGLPGAGKSYEVVNGPILRAASKGRTVWTNIPVTIPGVVVCDKPDEHWYLKAPAGALVVIDECWRYWPAGAAASAIPEAQKEWFAMHRHRTGDGLSTDIILVTQDLSQIAAFVRNLVEKTYRMRKLTALGTRNHYRVDVYDGAVTGQRPPAGRHIAGWRTKYKPEGFKTYKSHTQGGEGQELTVDKRGTVWSRPGVLLIPVAIIAMLALPKVVQSTVQKQAGVEPPAEPAPVVERSEHNGGRAAEPVALPPPPVVPTTEEKPPASGDAPPSESQRWVLLGVAAKADGTGVALLESSTGRRRIDLKDCDYNGLEWLCVIDGKYVTMWSGNGVLRLAQGSTYNAKASQ